MSGRVRSAADLARFEELFESHHAAILAYARRRTGSHEDAEDAAAETFATAWRRWESIPLDPLPWLYGVARRLLANQRRSGSRRLGLLERLRRDRGLPAEHVMGGGPATEALATLRADEQELLRLVAWEDLGPAQIAVVLGISPNAAAIRLHRARRRYADALREVRHSTMKESAPYRTPAPVTGSDVARHEELR